MAELVSKSRFKAHALRYFREVEATGVPLVITDRGRPVLRVVPYQTDRQSLLDGFLGSVERFDDPLAPVGEADWDALA